MRHALLEAFADPARECPGRLRVIGMLRAVTPLPQPLQRWLERLQDSCFPSQPPVSPTARMNQTAVSEYRLSRLDLLQVAQYRALHRITSSGVPLGYFALLARRAQQKAMTDAGAIPWPPRTQVIANRLVYAHPIDIESSIRVSTLLAFHFKESDGHASFTLTTSFMQGGRSAVINKTTFRYGTLGLHGDDWLDSPQGHWALLGVWRPRLETSAQVRALAQERGSTYPPCADAGMRRSPERDIDPAHCVGKTCAFAEARLRQPLRYAVHQFRGAILENEAHTIHMNSDQTLLQVRNPRGICVRLEVR